MRTSLFLLRIEYGFLVCCKRYRGERAFEIYPRCAYSAACESTDGVPIKDGFDDGVVLICPLHDIVCTGFDAGVIAEVEFQRTLFFVIVSLEIAKRDYLNQCTPFEVSACFFSTIP